MSTKPDHRRRTARREESQPVSPGKRSRTARPGPRSSEPRRAWTPRVHGHSWAAARASSRRCPTPTAVCLPTLVGASSWSHVRAHRLRSLRRSRRVAIAIGPARERARSTSAQRPARSRRQAQSRDELCVGAGPDGRKRSGREPTAAKAVGLRRASSDRRRGAPTGRRGASSESSERRSRRVRRRGRRRSSTCVGRRGRTSSRSSERRSRRVRRRGTVVAIVGVALATGTSTRRVVGIVGAALAAGDVSTDASHG